MENPATNQDRRLELAQQVKVENGLVHPLSYGVRAVELALEGCARTELRRMIAQHSLREKVRGRNVFSKLSEQKLEEIRRESLSLNGEGSLDEYLHFATTENSFGFGIYSFDLGGFLFPGSKTQGNRFLAYANELSEELGIPISEGRKKEIAEDHRKQILKETGKVCKGLSLRMKDFLRRNKETIVISGLVGLVGMGVGSAIYKNQLEEKTEQLNYYEQLFDERNREFLDAYVEVEDGKK